MATPGMAGGFGTGANAGLTEQQIQEQKMIKLVQHDNISTQVHITAILMNITDGLGGARIMRW